MAYNTNIDSGGPPNGGKLISKGTERRQVCLDIRDLIVDNSSRWEEVTSSSPTPTAIQQYASTIESSNVGNGSTGFSEHVTLYLSDDSALGFSNPGARLLRIVNGWKGIVVGILDSYFVDSPNDATAWAFASDKPFENPSNYAHSDEFTFINDNNIYSSNYTPTTLSDLQQDYKFFYAIQDEFIWMNVYLPQKTGDFGLRGFMAHVPSAPSNGTVGRKDVPFIWLLPGFENLSRYNDAFSIRRPASDTSLRQNHGSLRTFAYNQTTDTQNRYIFTPMWVKKDVDSGNAWHMDSTIPKVRLVGGKTGILNVNDNNYPTRTVNGNEYFLAGGQDDGDEYFFIEVA